MSWCDACQNTGWLDCHCGGDLCICDNNGEYPCPHCDGMPDDDECPTYTRRADQRRLVEGAMGLLVSRE